MVDKEDTMPQHPLPEIIDRAKAIQYLKKLVDNEMLKEHITSEAQLGRLMFGLSQGTISKLRLAKYNNIPDFDTLEAIAFYFGKSYQEFIIELGEQCPKELSEEELNDLRFKMGVAAISQLKDKKHLTELLQILVTQIRLYVLGD